MNTEWIFNKTFAGLSLSIFVLATCQVMGEMVNALGIYALLLIAVGVTLMVLLTDQFEHLSRRQGKEQPLAQEPILQE